MTFRTTKMNKIPWNCQNILVILEDLRVFYLKRLPEYFGNYSVFLAILVVPSRVV